MRFGVSEGFSIGADLQFKGVWAGLCFGDPVRPKSAAVTKGHIQFKRDAYGRRWLMCGLTGRRVRGGIPWIFYALISIKYVAFPFPNILRNKADPHAAKGKDRSAGALSARKTTPRFNHERLINIRTDL